MNIKLILSLLLVSSTVALGSESAQKKVSYCQNVSLCCQATSLWVQRTLFKCKGNSAHPYCAAQSGDVETLKRGWELGLYRDLYDEYGGHGHNKEWYYRTPLQAAVIRNHPDCVKFILEIGVDQSKKEKIVEACKKEECLKRCTCKDFVPKTRDGKTALEFAQDNVDEYEKKCKEEKNGLDDWNKKDLKKAQEILAFLSKKK